MTYSSDRLDRIEALLATVAESNAASAVRMDRFEANLEATRQITESNARAIEAWGSRIDEVQIETEEATSSTRADLAVRIDDNAHNQGIDRVRFDALHEEHTQRFNTLLEEARADRQRADRDRTLNESEHRAFRETFQTMLAEIARLWQRVAG
ncbi:hypothetical protein VB780_12670 [Leptolyngbya sp. CCNP1308]|uniref:hypothetical protein n=1 Tax=Leptolyngbya sp. CCNP1308 TaxID=3110255 RepID=UPI002B20AF14|nr:hypothetical protein [Leptolyngbya sp. CCNP1308]MEA5449429.1 hypothetical protein [Leptolyngbya sp. CCNP1308]